MIFEIFKHINNNTKEVAIDEKEKIKSYLPKNTEKKPLSMKEYLKMQVEFSQSKKFDEYLIEVLGYSLKNIPTDADERHELYAQYLAKDFDELWGPYVIERDNKAPVQNK